MDVGVKRILQAKDERKQIVGETAPSSLPFVIILKTAYFWL